MKKIAIFLLMLLLALPIFGYSRNIGIVTPSKKDFLKELTQTKMELKEILGDNLNVTVYEYKNISELEKLYNGGSLSKNGIVISLDPISSEYLNQKKSISGGKLGGTKLILPFRTSFKDFYDEALYYKSIYNYKDITLVTSKDINITNFYKKLNAQHYDKSLVKHVYIEDVAQNRGKYKASTEAILLYNPSRRSTSAVKKVVEDNLFEGIPSFEIGATTTNTKVLAGSLQTEGANRYLRESLLEIAEGSSFNGNNVKLTKKPNYFFNMNTSKQLQIYPSGKALSGVNLSGDYYQGVSKLNFKKAVNLAIDNNLNLKAGSYKLNSSAYGPKRAKSDLLPSLNATLDLTNRNDAFTKNSPIEAENTFRGGFEVSQVIFDDEVWENIVVQTKEHNAEKERYRRREADTIFSAASNYLNVLRSQASLNISKYNEGLSKEFLELARERKEVGISDASDVYRFESSYALAQADVKESQGTVERAQRALNQAMNIPIENKYDYENLSFEDSIFLTSNKNFLNLLENPVQVELFTKKFVKDTVEDIPEVRVLDYLIEARNRERKTAARRRITPVVEAKASLEWDLVDPFGENDTRLDGTDDKGEQDFWTAGISLKLPLYRGGDIAYETKQLENQVDELITTRDAIVEDYERVIGNQITALSVDYKRIKSAITSREASDKNLDLVRDKYAKGTIDVITLLDAQTDSVNAREQEVLATYGFMISILELERSVAKYYFHENSSEQNAINKDITNIVNRGGK